jgi:hypothetical protein
MGGKVVQLATFAASLPFVTEVIRQVSRKGKTKRQKLVSSDGPLPYQHSAMPNPSSVEHAPDDRATKTN